jgi:hypothetical protein
MFIPASVTTRRRILLRQSVIACGSMVGAHLVVGFRALRENQQRYELRGGCVWGVGASPRSPFSGWLWRLCRHNQPERRK